MNKNLYIGRLTRDPDLKNTTNSKVVKFGIAVDTYIKKGVPPEVLFLDCEAWDKAAELIAKHFKKGNPIILEGRLRYERWEKDGEKRSKHTLRIEKFDWVPGTKKADTETETQVQNESAPSGFAVAPAGDDGDIPF